MRAKRIVLWGLLLLMAVPGCGLTSRERVAILENAVVRAEKISDKLEVRLTKMESVLVETRTALADPNLSAELRKQLDDVLTQATEGIKAVSAKRGEYAGLISRLRAQIEAAKTDDMDFGDELKLYGEGLKTTAKYLPPPANGVVTLVGIAFGVIGSVLAKKRGGELQDVVRSVDKLLASDAVPKVDVATKILKGHQLPKTRIAIRKVRG